MKRALIATASLLLAAAAHAKVDVVTLPGSDKTQLTIYNSADLTLVRDTRTLTLRKGENRLEFSWAGTLIDPTSLELLPDPKAKGVSVKGVEYPPRVTGTGVWTVEAKEAGSVPFEITSFASGLSWRAFYLATIAPDDATLKLEGFVRVDNHSGEDYANAETRLVVGKVALLDHIAELAGRQYPYGAPLPEMRLEADSYRAVAPSASPMAEGRMMAKAAVMDMRPKEIVKEALSEYFLYTIEGTEDLPDGWGKRLASFSADGVKVKNLYRFEEERYGEKPVRFISFKNDAAHNLGKEPIPDGRVMVFRSLGPDGRLSYVDAQNVKYVPKGAEVDLQLGPTELVTVKPTLMDYSTANYEWKDDRITGWDERRTVKVEVENGQGIPAKVEIRRNFPVKNWELATEGEAGEYEKVDADTVGYTLTLKPGEKRVFSYKVLYKIGSRGL